MNYSVVFAIYARSDLIDIQDFLRQEHPAEAEEWLTEIHEAIRTLSTFPMRGSLHGRGRHIDVDIRQLVHNQYRISYIVQDEVVTIVSVFHMSRNPIGESVTETQLHHSHRFHQAIALIDAANAADPNTDILDGVTGPKEQIYGIRMMGWVERLDGEASEALKIAARAQHICRWEVPRSLYPEGKAGYYAWRTFLYTFHGERAGEIMDYLKYPKETIAEMKAIMDKKNLRTNGGTQTLEDAAALVFLENHFMDFSERDDMDEGKLVAILRKTWGKMSEAGHAAALELVLPDEAAALVHKALSG